MLARLRNLLQVRPPVKLPGTVVAVSSYLSIIRKQLMTTVVEVLSVAAATVSAVGGVFAVGAALQSSRSASKAQATADAMESRLALRDVALAAGEVQIESRRAQSRAEQLKLSYANFFMLSNSFGSSRQALYTAEIDKKTNRIAQLVEDAKKFDDGAESLRQATHDNILRVQVRLSNSTKEICALREELDREHDQIEGQCAERRESMDRAR